MKKKLTLFCLLLFFGILFLQVRQIYSNPLNSDEQNKKPTTTIAIATVGDSVNSAISTNAGRAPYYLIFDENGVLLKSVKNPAQSQSRRASTAVIALLLKESCKTVIAGKFGDKMQNQLKMNKIEYYEREGNALKTVQTFIKKQEN